MKNYIKPKLIMVELFVEERFASGSTCTVVGTCDPGTEYVYYNGVAYPVNNSY